MYSVELLQFRSGLLLHNQTIKKLNCSCSMMGDESRLCFVLESGSQKMMRAEKKSSLRFVLKEKKSCFPSLSNYSSLFKHVSNLI